MFRYRFWETSKKAGLYTIGEYPAVTLQDARRERERVREIVKSGQNPNQVKRNEKMAAGIAKGNTFMSIAEEWIEKKRPGWTAYYLKQINTSFKGDVYPAIGAMPIKSINALHILSILQKVEKRGAPAVAINIRQWCSAVFRYAVITQRAEMDPAAPLSGAVIRKPVENAKPMTAEAIADFLVRLEKFGGNRATYIALNLLLYLFPRTTELRHAEWSEFGDDEWIIGAEKMKMRRPHIVPLAGQVKLLIEELRTITGAGRWLFPNTRRPSDVISATTLNRSLEYMGYRTAEVTCHDFRATASTILHEKGYRDEWIEVQLAHVDKNKTRSAYNHALYLTDRRQMMQEWADYIDTLKPPSGDH